MQLQRRIKMAGKPLYSVVHHFSRDFIVYTKLDWLLFHENFVNLQRLDEHSFFYDTRASCRWLFCARIERDDQEAAEHGSERDRQGNQCPMGNMGICRNWGNSKKSPTLDPWKSKRKVPDF